jgi:hypothetical protein
MFALAILLKFSLSCANSLDSDMSETDALAAKSLVRYDEFVMHRSMHGIYLLTLKETVNTVFDQREDEPSR